MEIKITSATKEDIGQIAEFQLKMALETEELMLDRDLLIKGITAVTEDPSKAKYFLAKIGGTTAGMLMITLEWSDWRNGWVWWIQSVFVEEEFRKYGVFKALYHYIKQLVSDNDELKGIRLYVDKRNTRAQRVYENLGMTGEHYATYEWMK
jgi:GNAT superfamily N-acetyltransferase